MPGDALGRRSLVVALCCGYFLVLLDVTVVNVALPAIGRGFGASGAGLVWIVDAYAVPLAALLLTAGALGDRYGHAHIVIAGLAVFGTASVMCAAAPALPVLIAARSLQGSGAALLLPGTLALLMRTADGEAERTRLVGLWAAIGGAALPAGPLVGGAVVTALDWRFAFWLNVPIVVVATVPVLRLLRRGERFEGRSADEPFPVAGPLLLIVAMAGIVLALVQAPRSATTSGVALTVAATALVALLRVERRAATPLLTVPRSARGALASACLVSATMNACVLGALFTLTQVFQIARGLSPVIAGVSLIPALAPLPLLSGVAGRAAARFGVWTISAVGLVIAGLGFASLAVVIDAPEHLWTLLSLGVWGIGVGVLTPAIVAAAIHALPDSPGIASGAGNTSRQLGGAIGVALFGAGIGDGRDLLSSGQVLLGCAAAAFLLAALFCLARRQPRHSSSSRATAT